MPDVIIKGMEMPEMCDDCQIEAVTENYYGDIMSRRCPVTGKNTEEYGWKRKGTRPDWCPLHHAPEWINAKEAKPGSEKVLACWTANGEKVIDTAYWTPGGWNAIHWTAMTVTHWMPLPEPPKEVQDG